MYAPPHKFTNIAHTTPHYYTVRRVTTTVRGPTTGSPQEDIRVPFFMRGPGIPAGLVVKEQFGAVDLTATIMQAAGGRQLPQFDGTPMQRAFVRGGVPRERA